MVNFIISGLEDSTKYHHAVYVANYLASMLPDFHVKSVVVTKEEWPNYISEINRKYHTYHLKSPIILKELIEFGSKAECIGDLCEFWEYCYDYYALESIIPKKKLQLLVDEFLREKEEAEKNEDPVLLRDVMIYGSGTKLLVPLLEEIMKSRYFKGKNDIRISFCTDLFSEETSFSDAKDFLRNDYNMETTIYSNELVLTTTDIILISGCNLQKQNALVKFNASMNFLADEINATARRGIKILFANYGMSCYMATVLASKVNNPNVAVTSSDRGLSVLSFVSSITKVDLENLCGPPVYGFIGVDEFVDYEKTILKCNIYKPLQRTLKAKESTEYSLTQGSIETELRFLNYVTYRIPRLHQRVKEHHESAMDAMGRLPILSKVRAIISILELWYNPKQDAVISAGVLSDGSYDIPTKIVYSQPCQLIDDHWVPFPNYPVSMYIKNKIKKSSEKALDIVKTGTVLTNVEEFLH